MNADAHNGIDPAIRDRLERFCAGAMRAAPERVEGIVLHGSAMTADFVPGVSDVNVLVVSQGVDAAALAAWAPCVLAADREIRLAPVFLTPAELSRWGEMFPVRLLSMQRRYRVLHGSDLLPQQRVDRDSLRGHCELELLALTQRLRQSMIVGAVLPESLVRALAAGVSSLLHIVAVILLLRGHSVPVDKRGLAETAARSLVLDGRTLSRALELRAGSLRPDAAELWRLAGSMLVVVEETIGVVARLAP